MIPLALCGDSGKEEFYHNLSLASRAASGRLRFSIWIDFEFAECPAGLYFARALLLQLLFNCLRSGAVIGLP